MRDLINIVGAQDGSGSIFSHSVYKTYHPNPTPVFTQVGQLVEGLTVATADLRDDCEQTLHVVHEGQSVGRIGMDSVHDLPTTSSTFRITGLAFKPEQEHAILPMFEWIVRNACDYLLEDATSERWASLIESDRFAVYGCARDAMRSITNLSELAQAREQGASLVFAGSTEQATAVSGRLVESKLFGLSRLAALSGL